MAYLDPFASAPTTDALMDESAQIDGQLKALFQREAEHFERQMTNRNMQLNSRGLAQLELNLREFLNAGILSIEKDLRRAR